MTDPRTMQADLDRIAADLAAAAGDPADELPVMVMCEDDLHLDDPRLAPLVAQARSEGRMIVCPWEETDAGELIDTAAPGYARSLPAHVIELPVRDGDPPPPPTSS